MATKKSPVPAGYQTVTPYLRVNGAAGAIEFYKQAFGARERFRLSMGDRLGHAEITIGDATVMLSDEFPEMGISGPKSLNGTTCALSIYVSNTDAVFAAAIAAGGTAKRQPTDEFYGDRTAQIEDPFGHLWSIQQRLSEITPAEMQRRLDQLMATGSYTAAKEKLAKAAEIPAPKANAPKAATSKAAAQKPKSPAKKKR